eukprot:TRINITY_DN2457_c0_g1_i1.p2 TRINITY_DN2457_c0_g1~~TRINITY_DN2457_c0_g1_i1.p2  ORF type:complete len:107 (+),score=12.08 TRINITY_DN2457_c0_g1_i1:861-1181(+)
MARVRHAFIVAAEVRRSARHGFTDVHARLSMHRSTLRPQGTCADDIPHQASKLTVRILIRPTVSALKYAAVTCDADGLTWVYGVESQECHLVVPAQHRTNSHREVA